MWEGFKSNFKKEKLTYSAKSTAYALDGGDALFYSSIAPYIIPSVARFFINGEGSSSNRENSIGEDVPILAGLFLGVVGWGGQFLLYEHVARQKEHPEGLLMPLITNLISGGYELARKSYGNAKQRIVEKNSANPLEKTLETSKNQEILESSEYLGFVKYPF